LTKNPYGDKIDCDMAVVSIEEKGAYNGRQGQERQGKGSETEHRKTATKGTKETGETTEKKLLTEKPGTLFRPISSTR
jgi:hypothetical protein